MRTKNLRRRDSLVLNATVDEAGNLLRRLLGLSGIAGDDKLLEEVVKNLDGLSVFRRHGE